MVGSSHATGLNHAHPILPRNRRLGPHRPRRASQGGGRCPLPKASHDVGPDTADPKNFTWGADPTLAGPDLSRVPAAIASGNSVGYTERLDYVFVRGEITIVSSKVVGNSWPTCISTWSCGADAQVSNSAKAAVALGVSAPDQAVCFGSDHAAVVVVAQLGTTASSSSSSRIWFVVAGVFIVVIVAAIVWGLVRRSSGSPPIESE